MDDAFLTLSEMLAGLAPSPAEFRDVEGQTRTYVSAFEIESAIELQVVRSDRGGLEIAAAPPLYRVDTSLRPAYHTLRCVACSSELDDE